MDVRESFQQIYQAESLEIFAYLLKRWYFGATHSQLAPMKKVAKTIKQYWNGIIRWKESRINGSATNICPNSLFAAVILAPHSSKFC